MELNIITNPNDQNLVELASSFETELVSGMSDYQIKRFVLNDKEFPTVDSKYYQSIRELHKRYSNLITLQYEHDKLKSEIEIEQADLIEKVEEEPRKESEEIRYNAEIKLIRNEIRYKEKQLEILKRTAKEVLREMHSFYESYVEHKDQRQHASYEAAEEETWQLRMNHKN